MTPAQIIHTRQAVKLPGKPSLHTATQNEFAAVLGVSVRTLQSWEQGKRQPSGAAASLLKLIAAKPGVIGRTETGLNQAAEKSDFDKFTVFCTVFLIC